MKYAVITQHGDLIDTNLTAAEAAQAILNHDGQDFEIRANSHGDGFDLWTRQQVAGRGWHKTVIYSLETRWPMVEADIFAKVIAANWRGQPSAMTTESYAKMIEDAAE